MNDLAPSDFDPAVLDDPDFKEDAVSAVAPVFWTVG
jgi:hypothetical protein